MSRWFIGSLAFALIATVSVSPSLAAKGSGSQRVTGQIQSVSEDGTTITVGKQATPKKAATNKSKSMSKSKAKAKTNAKKRSAVKEIKIDDSTIVDYHGIENANEQKLAKGYYILAAVGKDGTAKTLNVSKVSFDKAKSKTAMTEP